ncbi:MAG: DUF4184 family protein [Promethearchaeota archaeon]
MPSALLSHQAPVLPLKMAFPKKFDGTALLLGSMMPDLELLFGAIAGAAHLNWDFHYGHSLVGLVAWTLPWTLLFTVLFSRWVGPWWARVVKSSGRVGALGRYFGVDELYHLSGKQFNARWLFVASYSAVVGGLTHLLLDFPSHGYCFMLYPWYVWRAPESWFYEIADFGTLSLGPFSYSLNLTLFNLVWLLESVGLAALCLVLLRVAKKYDLVERWYSTPVGGRH